MRDVAPSVARFVLVALVPVVAVVCVGGGCSSPAPVSEAGPDAEALCPATLAATIGAACSVGGLTCSPQYPCGVVPAAARCVCTGGAFACSDVTGAPLVGPDAMPACPRRADAEACPPDESSATLAPCTETWLVCSYLAGCNTTPAFDQCVCEFGPLPKGSQGLAFRCSSHCQYITSPYDAGLAQDASPHASD